MARSREDRLLNPNPGSAIARAKEFGIDLMLLNQWLKLTPEQRLDYLQQAMIDLEELRGAAATIRKAALVTKLRQTLQLLAKHEVEFIIIGGVADSVHASSYVTFDLDICDSGTTDNHRRILAALRPYHPRLRDIPEGFSSWDETTLSHGTRFKLSTDLGEIDLLGEVKGVGTYHEALAFSLAIPLYGNNVRLLSLEALIASKRAAGRPKDLLILPELEAMLEADAPEE